MGLRGLAGQFAKASSGLWQGVAEAIDPPRRQPAPTSPPHRADSQASDPLVPGPVPEGSMLVPLDTWTRILEQIGHVHEAGQQLADARERAARAETENEFLRTQVADLKARKRSTPKEATRRVPAASESAEAEPLSDSAPSPTARTVRRARERASRWLSP